MNTPRKPKVRFKERAEQLDFLLEVSAVTTETLDLDRLLESVAEMVGRVLPYQLLAILLYNERYRGLKVRHAIGHRPEVVKSLMIPLGEGITGAAGADRKTILVGDVRNDPRYLNALDAVRTELAVPMIARGKLVGVIDLQSTKLDAFTEYDCTLLKLIASRVATAIENARLYRRVDRQNRTFKTLARLSQEFSAILDLDELLNKIAVIMRELISYDAFSILLVDTEKRVLRHRFSLRFDEHVQLDNIPLGKGLTGAAAESRQPVRVDDTSRDPRYIQSHPGIRSEMAVPLIVQDRVVGVVDLESKSAGYYTEENVRTLVLLAPQIAASVENARLYEELARRKERMEEDLKAARRVQRVLLPKTAPELAGLEIAVSSKAAREITGDVYDFFESGAEHALIAFGDSSGKGAAAALYGALVSGLLRTMAPRRRSPALLLQKLNEELMERQVDAQYVTLVVLLWHAYSRTLTISNAGAIPPVIVRGGELLKPEAAGVPLGLLDAREYDEAEFAAQRGDLILLYSDGIADAPNLAGEEYGKSKLDKFLKRLAPDAAPADVLRDLLAELAQHTEGTGMFDDQTMIAMKVL